MALPHVSFHLGFRDVPLRDIADLMAEAKRVGSPVLDLKVFNTNHVKTSPRKGQGRKRHAPQKQQIL